MTFRSLIFLLLLVAVFPASPVPVFAEDQRIVITEAVQLKLGDAFMAEDEYYRAITEYKKFLFLFPDSGKAGYASFRIGLAYYRGQEYEAAAQTFATVKKKYKESGYVAESGYFEGLSYWKLGRFDRAETMFEQVVAQAPASAQAPLALLGKSLVSFDEKNLPGCREGLSRFLTSYPDDPQARNVRQTIALLDEKGEPPRKSPVLAGMMSALVPGSGYMYAGRYGDGITALVVNGLFIAGTVVAIHQEEYAVAAIVGGVGLPFYVGNIYGSANAATKWNIGVRKELRERIVVSLDYHY